jgi:Fe-S cluster assembly scaffold IscU
LQLLLGSSSQHAAPAVLSSAAAGARSYHENVVDHYERPRNVGSFDKKAENVGTGLVGAPACGDVMKLQIKVDENGFITDSCFKTFGCGSAIASSSVATEWVKGKSLDEVVRIKNSEIAKHLSLPPVKLHCSMLAEDAIKVGRGAPSTAIAQEQQLLCHTPLGIVPH